MSTHKSINAFLKAEANGAIKYKKHKVLKIIKDSAQGLTIRQVCTIYANENPQDERDASPSVSQLYAEGSLSITNELKETDPASIYKFEPLTIPAMNNRRIQIATKKIKAISNAEREIARLIAEVLNDHGIVPIMVLTYVNEASIQTALEKLRK